MPALDISAPTTVKVRKTGTRREELADQDKTSEVIEIISTSLEKLKINSQVQQTNTTNLDNQIQQLQNRINEESRINKRNKC